MVESVTELSKQACATMQITSERVNLLERQGWVTSEYNNRVKRVYLTPKGVLLAIALQATRKLLETGLEYERFKYENMVEKI